MTSCSELLAVTVCSRLPHACTPFICTCTLSCCFVVAEDSSSDSAFPVVAVCVPVIVIIIGICVTVWWKKRSKRTSQSVLASSVVYSNQRQSASVTAVRPSPEKSELWTAPRLLVEMPEPPSYGEAVVMPVPQPPVSAALETDLTDPVTMEPGAAADQTESDV